VAVAVPCHLRPAHHAANVAASTAAPERKRSSAAILGTPVVAVRRCHRSLARAAQNVAPSFAMARKPFDARPRRMRAADVAISTVFPGLPADSVAASFVTGLKASAVTTPAGTRVAVAVRSMAHQSPPVVLAGRPSAWATRPLRASILAEMHVAVVPRYRERPVRSVVNVGVTLAMGRIT